MTNRSHGPVPPEPPNWPQPSTQVQGRSTRWPILVAIFASLLAVVFAGAALFQAGSPPVATQPRFTAVEVSQAKDTMCATHQKIANDFAIQDKRRKQYPPGDPAYPDVLLNSRILLNASAQSLMLALNAHPATPDNIADGSKKLASMWTNIVLDQIANVPSEKINEEFDEAKAVWTPILDVCK